MALQEKNHRRESPQTWPGEGEEEAESGCPPLTRCRRPRSQGSAR